MNDLFDPDFLASLNQFRILARRVPRGGRHADQRSSDLGSGIEFHDFRQYSRGDEFRSIDWNIYRRLGRVFVRLFEEMEDLPLYLMPDVSRSLFVETPPRARAGLRCALALASISLGQHDRVGVFPFAEDLLEPLNPTTGKARLHTVVSYLSALQPGGKTDLRRSLLSFEARRLRPGLLVLISDFFDPAGIDAVLPSLRRSRHRLLLVQLHRRHDEAPEVQGDVRFVDSETGDVRDVTVDGPALERYRRVYGAFQDTLTSFARSRGAGFLRLDVDGDVTSQLAGLFQSRKFLA